MTFEEWLFEELDASEQEAKESHKAAMNSYGAGHDAGYVAALKVVSMKMTPDLARVVIGQFD